MFLSCLRQNDWLFTKCESCQIQLVLLSWKCSRPGWMRLGVEGVPVPGRGWNWWSLRSLPNKTILGFWFMQQGDLTENDIMVWTVRDFWRMPRPPHLFRECLSRIFSSWLMNISRHGGCTTSLDKLWLKSLTVNALWKNVQMGFPLLAGCFFSWCY